MLLVFLLFACSVHRIASVSPVNDHPLSEQELLVFKIELTRQRTMINRLLDRPFADKCDIDSFLMEALFDQPITDESNLREELVVALQHYIAAEFNLRAFERYLNTERDRALANKTKMSHFRECIMRWIVDLPELINEFNLRRRETEPLWTAYRTTSF